MMRWRDTAVANAIAEIPLLRRHPLHLCEMYFAPALFSIRASKYALKISRRGAARLCWIRWLRLQRAIW